MSTTEVTETGRRTPSKTPRIKYPIPTNKRPANPVNISNVLELLKVHLVDTGELFHPKNAQDDLGLGRTVWVAGLEYHEWFVDLANNWDAVLLDEVDASSIGKAHRKDSLELEVSSAHIHRDQHTPSSPWDRSGTHRCQKCRRSRLKDI